MDDATTIDALLDGRLSLRQPAKGHRAGTDALLLAAAARSLPGVDVAYFGAGVGTAGLALALVEPSRRVMLTEIDPFQAGLCAGNIIRNQLESRVRAVALDITSPSAMDAAGLGARSVDVVMMNPPFLDTARARTSPLAQRRGAHAMPAGGLVLWMKAARRCLRPKGHVALVHRADALGEIMAAMAGFGALVLRPVHPRAGQAAHRLLVTARLASKTPAVILPGFVLHEADGSFTAPSADLHRALAALP
jgi:tRNA1(Val) A37 N6-methylase TrmN6